MRRKAKLDSNQPEIVSQLKAAGYSVVSLASMHKGIPDLLVGKNEITVLIELKSTKNAKLTPDQQKFRECWFGGYYVCRSFDDVEKVFNEKNKIEKEQIGKKIPRQKKNKSSKLAIVGSNIKS